jgi:cysteine desulfurase
VIYLDHNATTPIAPAVLEAMMPYLTSEWGNPSSPYKFGARLKTVIETARERVAELIGASPREIIFTSGGTESNNAAIHAALKANPGKRHLVTSAVEHSSVLNLCRALQCDHEGIRIRTNQPHEGVVAQASLPAGSRGVPLRGSTGGGTPPQLAAGTAALQGHRVTYLPVDREGLLRLADLENAITDDTAVVSLMWANNETGVLFPVREIAGLCHSRGVLFHCDVVQAVGKVPVDVRELPVDYLSLTGHKFGAPKGVGALYVRRKAPFTPLIHGGHQERGLRGGTECVPLIVGLGRAAELVRKNLPGYEKKVRPLRDALENGILGHPRPSDGRGAGGEGIPNTELNGHPTLRLANTTNITFHGVESEALLLLLDQEGICASSGSACLADSDEPSHVVKAMKPDSTASRQMIRFSLGFENTDKDVEATLSAVRTAANTLRG